MKKLSFFVAGLMIFSQLGQTLAAPQAPVPPPAPYAVDGSISYRTLQTNQQAQSARNASMTLEIGNANGLFPYLLNTGDSCFNVNGPGRAYAYSFFLDSSSINMSQCVAWNNTEIIRNSTAFIIDPFWDYLTQATPTEIANAIVAKGTLGTAFTITSGGGRRVIFTRTNSNPGNILFTDSDFHSSDAFRVISVISGQSAISPREQQSEFVPSNPQPGEVFTIEINGYEYNYTVLSGDDVTDVSYGLWQAYDADKLPGIGCDYQGEKVYCYGNNDSVSFSVYGQVFNPTLDTVAPQITIEGKNFVGTQTGSMDIEAGEPHIVAATWIDNRNVIGGSVVGSGESLDTSATGSIVRTYTQTDNDNNTTTVTFTYVVKDTTAPGIELNGNYETTQEIDEGPYVDEGANTTDTFDGDGYITGTIIEDNRGALGTGTYILEYVATDRSGNERSTQRTVEVVDTYGPSIQKLRFPTNPIDADYYFIDWRILDATSVVFTGTSLTGTYIPKMANTNTYRVLLPLTQNTTNTFTLFASDIRGNKSNLTFSLTESGTGEIGQAGSITSTGGASVIDVSEVTGSSTGATKVVPKVPMTIRDNVGEWSINVNIPTDTEITRKGGGTFDATKLETKLATVTGGLTGYDRSRGAIDFGPTGVPLLFSKPVKIEFYIDRNYTGSTIEVKVRHGGETTFSTSGLTNNPNATCTNGIPSSGTNIATVDTESHLVTIYTCAASTYAAVTPDGTLNPSTTTSSSSSSGGGGTTGGNTSNPTSNASTIIQSGSTVLFPVTGSVNTGGLLWTPIIPKKPSKVIEKYTLTLPSTFDKRQTVTLPVGFKEKTKVTIRVKVGKITYKITATVKNGTITFRPRGSGTYEVLKK